MSDIKALKHATDGEEALVPNVRYRLNVQGGFFAFPWVEVHLPEPYLSGVMGRWSETSTRLVPQRADVIAQIELERLPKK